MILSREKGLQLIHDSPEEMLTMCFYGDQLRLQQVLSDFLLNALRFTPPSEGWVGIKVVSTKKHLGSGVHIVHLEFRYVVYRTFDGEDGNISIPSLNYNSLFIMFCMSVIW
eukprot:Gb_17898 [translate_table: standard]